MRDRWRKQVLERHSPEVVCGLTVAAACRKAPQSADGVTHCQAGCEGIASGERRHMMLAKKPRRHGKRRNQTAREYTAGLKRLEAENFAQILTKSVTRVPVQNDIEHLCANNSGQHDRYPEIPCVLRFDPLFG